MTLEKKNLPHVKEELYKLVLNNGLTVYLLPKADFKELSISLSVPFGAVDSCFTIGTKEVSFPLGLAHFLEHKLFELEDGSDVSNLFTSLGVDSNAFTTYTATNYSLSAVGNLEQSVKLLIDFVLNPCFTESSIALERDIITQEIDMYEDDPDYRLYQGILQNLYPNTALSADIAGTRESISQVNQDSLKTAHDLFYRPETMTLFVMGGFNVEDLVDSLSQYSIGVENGASKVIKHPIEHAWVLPTKSITMAVARPKLALGLRGKVLEKGKSPLRQKLNLKLFFTMLFGETSSTYQKWYETGKIDDAFDIEIDVSDRYQFVILSMDTLEPIALSNRMRRLIRGLPDNENLNEPHFELLRRDLYGDYVMSLDSLDTVTSQFVTYLTKDELYFDLPDILEQLSFDEVLKTGLSFISGMDITDFTILPK